jgi:hypothetical protein
MLLVPPARETHLLGSRSDLACLFAPPLLVAALVAASPYWPAGTPLLLVGLAGFPGLAHILSTPAVYLDRSNRALFRRRALQFYVAPALLVAAGSALAVGSPRGLTPLLLLAAVFHNTRQSTGILCLTRRSAALPRELRPREEGLVWAANLACLVWTPLVPLPAPLRLSLGAVTLAGVLVALVLWALALRREPFASAPSRHLAFLLVSATLSWPLAAVADPLAAWALMALPHQAQYLGVFWTCQQRRYRALGGDQAHPLLRSMVRDPWLGMTLLAAAALLLRGLEAAEPGAWQRAALACVLSLTLAHYWLDAFLWRARDPEMRGLLLAHLPPVPAPR